jgi:hypothetical protein
LKDEETSGWPKKSAATTTAGKAGLFLHGAKILLF